jgi:hypothetical protein
VHIVKLQSDRALLGRRGPGKYLIVGSPVHPARSFGKRFGEIGTPAKAHPDLLHSADGAIPRVFGLARKGQAAATSAREYRRVA